MLKGIILFFIGLSILGLVLYSVFCWTPGRDSRKEEQEHKPKWSDYLKEEEHK